MRTVTFFLFFLTAFVSINAVAKEVILPKTTYTPLFRDPGEINTIVGPLLVDETPVTNEQFLSFIKKYPQYSKFKILKLYVDSNYLSHWKGDINFKKTEANFPVTNVSWFVAKKYCALQGKRLPTIAEWEVASDAQSPEIEAKVLEWYGRPKTNLRSVNEEPINKYGLKGSHGLIWEWVDNFSEAIMSGDSRGGSSTESLFCGGAALKAKDPRLYATFMRFAYRSSLTAKYSSANLGFRCVQDIKEGSK